MCHRQLTCVVLVHLPDSDIPRWDQHQIPDLQCKHCSLVLEQLVLDAMLPFHPVQVVLVRLVQEQLAPWAVPFDPLLD